MEKALRIVMAGCLATAFCLAAAAKDMLTVAVLPFSEQGAGVKDQGGIVPELLFARLSENPKLWLVEREKLDQILKSAALNLSGLVDPAQAPGVGRLIGADVLITGSVFKVQNKTYLVAKVISAETSRAFGKSVSGVDGVDRLGNELADNVAKIIEENGEALAPKGVSEEDMVAVLKKTLGDEAPLLAICVIVTERHVGRPTLDPAAATELIKILKALKFTVTEDPAAADIRLSGEAFSEFAGRREELLSAMGTVELKALGRKGEVIAADRQTEIAVGLAEETAGKEAIQRAAARLAGRVIPRLPKK